MLSTQILRVFAPGRRRDRQIRRAKNWWAEAQQDRAIDELLMHAKRSPRFRSRFESEAAALLMGDGKWSRAYALWISSTHALGKRKDDAAVKKAASWLLNAATCAYLSGNLAGSAIEMVCAAKLDPSLAQSAEFILLNARLRKLAWPEEAARALEDGARLYHADHALHYEAAELLITLGRFDAALYHASKAVELRPDDSPSRILMIRAKEQLVAAGHVI